MGRVKQLSIENELPDSTSVHTEMTRMYKMNGSYLTREEFIGQLALCIYDNEPSTDIRKTIDLLLNDTDMKELVCSGGNTFFSYFVSEKTKHSRQYDFDGDISSIVVEKYMETPSRGLRRGAGIIEDPIAGIEDDSVEHALNTYKVSYDILVVPTIPILQRRKTYKRAEETVLATSFREAKEMVRQKLTDSGKVTKSFTVELVGLGMFL